MAVVTHTPAENTVLKKTKHQSTFVRVSRYIVVRLLTLFVTVVIGVYLTILIANMGGFVDQIMKGEIRDKVTQSIINSPTAQQMDPDVRAQLIRDRIAAEENAITGAVLGGFVLGWAMLAVLSVRFTDQPQRWAAAPARRATGARCPDCSPRRNAELQGQVP